MTLACTICNCAYVHTCNIVWPSHYHTTVSRGFDLEINHPNGMHVSTVLNSVKMIWMPTMLSVLTFKCTFCEYFQTNPIMSFIVPRFRQHIHFVQKLYTLSSLLNYWNVRYFVGHTFAEFNYTICNMTFITQTPTASVSFVQEFHYNFIHHADMRQWTKTW